MAVYDASCEWIQPPNKEWPGYWQFNAGVFRQRLNMIFEEADAARFNNNDEESIRETAMAIVDATTPQLTPTPQ